MDTTTRTICFKALINCPELSYFLCCFFEFSPLSKHKAALRRISNVTRWVSASIYRAGREQGPGRREAAVGKKDAAAVSNETAHAVPILLLFFSPMMSRGGGGGGFQIPTWRAGSCPSPQVRGAHPRRDANEAIDRTDALLRRVPKRALPDVGLRLRGGV